MVMEMCLPWNLSIAVALGPALEKSDSNPQMECGVKRLSDE